MNVLKEPHHIIKITKPSPQSSEDTSINQSLEKSSKPVVDDEIRIRVTVSRMDLATIIKLRMGSQLRTNATVQSRVNKRMLRGFEGFHGELTKLWDNVEDIAREDVIRRVAEDKLRNRRKRKNQEKNKTRWEVSQDENLNPILTDTWTGEKRNGTNKFLGQRRDDSGKNRLARQSVSTRIPRNSLNIGLSVGGYYDGDVTESIGRSVRFPGLRNSRGEKYRRGVLRRNQTQIYRDINRGHRPTAPGQGVNHMM